MLLFNLQRWDWLRTGSHLTPRAPVKEGNLMQQGGHPEALFPASLWNWEVEKFRSGSHTVPRATPIHCSPHAGSRPSLHTLDFFQPPQHDLIHRSACRIGQGCRKCALMEMIQLSDPLPTDRTRRRNILWAKGMLPRIDKITMQDGKLGVQTLWISGLLGFNLCCLWFTSVFMQHPTRILGDLSICMAIKQ